MCKTLPNADHRKQRGRTAPNRALNLSIKEYNSMNAYDAAELAYKRGFDKGRTEGYARGYKDGRTDAKSTYTSTDLLIRVLTHAIMHPEDHQLTLQQIVRNVQREYGLD